MKKKTSVTTVYATLDFAYTRWNWVKQHGCSDPDWTDGINLNMIRTNIMRCIEQLGEIARKFPIPPEAPDSFMVAGGDYLEERLPNIEKKWDITWQM